MLSPIVPESLYPESTGTDGAAGATVSTLNGNGETVIVGRGATSLAVSVWAPSDSAVVVVMQTLPLPAELNVPIETPSIATEYDERPPSPISQKLGLLLELAVLSEPICRF
jgi:hypothetical protein